MEYFSHGIVFIHSKDNGHLLSKYPNGINRGLVFSTSLHNGGKSSMKTLKTVLIVMLIANGMLTLVNIFEWALNSLDNAEQIKSAKIERIKLPWYAVPAYHPYPTTFMYNNKHYIRIDSVVYDYKDYCIGERVQWP